MKIARALAVVLLVAACGGASIPPASAGNDTKVSVVTDWDGDDEGVRVVKVVTPQGPIVCVQMKDKYGGGFNDDPKGVSISIDCNWLPQ